MAILTEISTRGMHFIGPAVPHFSELFIKKQNQGKGVGFYTQLRMLLFV